MGNFKYAAYTNKIYVSIFREKASEYRKILKLDNRDNVRATFYAEVLDLIASYESGFGDMLQQQATVKGRKLTTWEVDGLFKTFESQAHWKPLIEKARMKMASRDLAFRDALHLQLKEYITPVQREDYERFLGEKSKELAERLEDAKDVMKRLKEREYLYCVSSFLREMENISYHVAAGNIDKELLQEIITAHLMEEENSESLKLKILNAISG